MVKFKGDDIAKELKDELLKDHPLDEENDKPLPEWAIGIMKDKRIGYRTRIKIVMMHHWDITGENPSWRFVQPSDMKNTPEREAPKDVKDFRMKQKEKADEYLSKHK